MSILLKQKKQGLNSKNTSTGSIDQLNWPCYPLLLSQLLCQCSVLHGFVTLSPNPCHLSPNAFLAMYFFSQQNQQLLFYLYLFTIFPWRLACNDPRCMRGVHVVALVVRISCSSSEFFTRTKETTWTVVFLPLIPVLVGSVYQHP